MSADPPGRTATPHAFAAHPWHGVAASPPGSEAFHAFIEIVPTDTVKYEIDKLSGQLRLDRPQLFSSICPTLYGFIPQSYCGAAVAQRCAQRTGLREIRGDGDPLDVCVLTEKDIAHGNLFVCAIPIGGLRLIDGDQADDKIIAVLEADLAFGALRAIRECPGGMLERLQHYFLSYKQRPGDPSHSVQIAEVYDRDEALRVIELSLRDYRERFGEPRTASEAGG